MALVRNTDFPEHEREGEREERLANGWEVRVRLVRSLRKQTQRNFAVVQVLRRQ